MIVSLKRTVATVAIAFLAFLAPNIHAQSTNSIMEQIQPIVEKIQAKYGSGIKNEADFATDFKQIDLVLAQQNGAKTEDAAEVIYAKAMIYAQMFGDFDKATDLIKKIKSDYPATRPGQDADKILDEMAKRAESKKIQANLIAGKTFPGFSETDLDGKPLSPAGFKGKVLLIDFWATWCPPCRAELPNVIAIYQKYHAQGFEIIGVSLDSDKDKLTSFIKDQNIAWPQYFDGQGWSNKLAAKYGVEAIPYTILVDGDGKIIGTELRGDDLESAVAKALKQ
jgi:thiol-disulfide isomerase/thioredoxin